MSARETDNPEVTAAYDDHLRRAEHAASERRVETAMAHLKEAMAVDPLRPEAFDLLGELYETLGEPDKAQRLYRAALALDPSYQRARRDLYRTVGLEDVE